MIHHVLRALEVDAAWLFLSSPKLMDFHAPVIFAVAGASRAIARQKVMLTCIGCHDERVQLLGPKYEEKQQPCCRSVCLSAKDRTSANSVRRV